MEFIFPITACNLMIEFAEFYEVAQVRYLIEKWNRDVFQKIKNLLSLIFARLIKYIRRNTVFFTPHAMLQMFWRPLAVPQKTILSHFTTMLHFLPLKSSRNIWFSDFFRSYGSGTFAWNGFSAFQRPWYWGFLINLYWPLGYWKKSSKYARGISKCFFFFWIQRFH